MHMEAASLRLLDHRRQVRVLQQHLRQSLLGTAGLLVADNEQSIR
jgi:hypothetical protein